MLSFRSIFFFSLVLFLCIGFGGAQELKISPTHLNFTGNIGEKICEQVSVFPSSNLVFSNLWSLNGTKQIGDYSLLSEKLGLSVYYSGFEDNKTNICIIASRAGRFYGALLFRNENSSMGIGTWASVEIEGDSINTDSSVIPNFPSFKITGNAIGNNNANVLFLTLGIMPTLILALFLIYLIRKLKR